MSFEEVKREALKLSADERLELAYVLLRSLEDEGLEIDWERFEVIGRRKQSPVAQ